jgi:hypothetical protein
MIDHDAIVEILRRWMMTLFIDIVRYVSIIQLSFSICLKEEIQLLLDVSIYIYVDTYILAFWPFSLCLNDDESMSMSPLFLSCFISLLLSVLFLLHTCWKNLNSIFLKLIDNEPFMTINVLIMLAEAFGHRHIVALAINICNMPTSTMFHTLCNCCYCYDMFSLLVFALYRHTVYTSM